MGLSRNIHSYDDIRAVLDAALAEGGGRYTLATPGQAVYWRARAYYFRKLLYNLAEERLANAPGMTPSTPYDQMKLTLEEGTGSVLIQFIKPQGTLTRLDGTPIELRTKAEPDEEIDALVAEAERLAQEHGEE